MDEDIRECVDCHRSLRLEDGMEWPAEPEDTRCWSCQYEEVERLQGLAYIGEHHFDDLTWKHRCTEQHAEIEQLRGERSLLLKNLTREQRDLATRTRELDEALTAAHYIFQSAQYGGVPLTHEQERWPWLTKER